MEAVWRIGLEGTELAKAQVGTIRLFFSSGYPYQNIFRLVSERLASG